MRAIPFPQWMRRAMFATAAMNILVAAAFLPAARSLRELAGMPDAHPFYLLTVGLFILLFGIVYLWMAIRGRGDRFIVAWSAAGKLGFFALTVHLWRVGELPLRTPGLAAADLVFGGLFLFWVITARAPAPGPTPAPV